jgi:hypothetical protein
MSEVLAPDLEKLALDAARQVAGTDSVEGVEVFSDEDDMGRPAYRFVFLINQERAKLSPGLVRIRLIQHLLDDLITRGDDHMPMIEILDRTDWHRRPGA